MSTNVRFTSADLLAFPEDGKRREIIDGDLIVSTQPHYYHQVISDDLVSALNGWGLPRGAGRAVSAPRVIFSEEEDVAPDIAWVSGAQLPHILAGGKFRSAPDLIVEILSPGRRQVARDRETKRKLYSRHGVREYWIVDWPQRMIEVYRRTDEQLSLVVTLFAGDTLTSPLLPEFTLPLADLFAGIPAVAEIDEVE
jgi:Uma2 family endonuclease